jgi:predicted glycosyltransferase
MKRLENKVEFLITARDHDKILPMLDAKGIQYFKVGKHGGKYLDDKLRAYADTIQQLIPIVKKEKPDLLITERWPESVRTAFGFNIPSWTIFYDEREYHVNWMTFPLSAKIFTPTFYTHDELMRQGVTDITRIRWFDGFHTCYLKDSTFDKRFNPFHDLGLEPPVVLIRPEPEFATFFGKKQRILEETITMLKKEADPSIVVFPRNKDQEKRFSKNVVNIFDNVTYECPVAYADVTLGAAETMLMESFVLGTPTISAVYWTPAKPVTELHKYIPHSTNPKELVNDTINFFDQGISRKFREMAKATVGRMENPVDIIIDEIDQLFGSSKRRKRKKSRRSRMEILVEILQNITQQPLIFSHLMQRINVTHRELKSDLQLLEKRELVERFIGKNNRISYKTTQEGQRVLRDYRKITHVLEL